MRAPVSARRGNELGMFRESSGQMREARTGGESRVYRISALTGEGTARLTGDRLVGTWGLFTVDGAEVFRGEWEAIRANESLKK